MSEDDIETRHGDKLWQVDLDDFVGRALISDAFSVDGTDEEFDLLYDWVDFGSPVWEGRRGSERYEIVDLLDFEPLSVVLRHEGETVGFYSDAICWIDEGHRGRGLSVDLIRAGIALLGEVPNLNKVGFSVSGWAAHAAAHREALKEVGRDPSARLSSLLM